MSKKYKIISIALLLTILANTNKYTFANGIYTTDPTGRKVYIDLSPELDCKIDEDYIINEDSVPPEEPIYENLLPKSNNKTEKSEPEITDGIYTTDPTGEKIYIDFSPELDCKADYISSEYTLPAGEPIYENLLPSNIRANITVKITSPCDQDFRKTYPNSYDYEANKAIEYADDYLVGQFGIDYESVSQPIWTSPNSKDSETILNDAINDHGLSYDGNKVADLMIAFSGKTSNNNIIGRSNRIGGNCAVIFNTTDSGNAYNVQHETGHLYSLRHHDDSKAGLDFPSNPKCVMEQGLNIKKNYDKLCKPHLNQWSNNKYNH